MIYLFTVDHLAPHPPLLETVHDLGGTYPTQETCPISSRRFGRFHPATRTVAHTHQEYIYPPKYLYHGAGIDGLPEVGAKYSLQVVGQIGRGWPFGCPFGFGGKNTSGGASPMRTSNTQTTRGRVSGVWGRASLGSGARLKFTANDLRKIFRRAVLHPWRAKFPSRFSAKQRGGTHS